ncbi:hypothetical protein N7539_002133 [Penicillium diatomitis]|uniref:Uncharacterized protein n=1 Tax=Penicillium diatomitis TaxID=2819901 RepID=A0A9X0C0A7_9EURO|nr:uncharacterized protein N7539_002133 [Penicillium diatomitis]KAJ5493387.1 hypothetical protein N7539_002133 [Penicillium diatomitis]
MKRSIPTVLSLLSFFTSVAQANVEKTIFLGPPAVAIPPDTPHLDPLGMMHLSPQNSVVRTYLNASFPTVEIPQGIESWFFLEDLTPGQRYEARICWLATQPTSFTLTTYTLSQAMNDPILLSSLSKYSTSHLAALAASAAAAAAIDDRPVETSPLTQQRPQETTLINDSILFLRVQAAADYFSPDQALMQRVPPVVVDVILDPFLMNVFPRSLVPTAAWMGVVGVVAVVVAKWVGRELGRLIDDARAERDEVEKEKKEI